MLAFYTSFNQLHHKFKFSTDLLSHNWLKDMLNAEIVSYQCTLVPQCYGRSLDGLGFRSRYSKSEFFLSSTFPVFTSLNFFAWQSATVTCYHIPHQILAEGYKVEFFFVNLFLIVQWKGFFNKRLSVGIHKRRQLFFSRFLTPPTPMSECFPTSIRQQISRLFWPLPPLNCRLLLWTVFCTK